MILRSAQDVRSRKVVITGAGVASPAGYTLESLYSAVWEGKPCFTEITRFSTAGSSVRYAGDCPEPDTKKLPDRKVQKILRRKDVISLLTTLETARHGGISKGSVDPERIGMYVGAGSTQIGDLTPYFTLVAQCANMEQGTFDSNLFGSQLMALVNPLVVLQTLMNNALCFGTMTLDIRGVNCNFMDFQVAGLRAIGEGFRSIAYNRADVVIAGGVAGPVEPFQLAEGLHTGYLARTKDLTIPLAEVVKPYDKRRQGAILSEGSAYVMLEEEEHAIRRGAKILAHVEGFGLASDGAFNFMDERESPGLVRALKLASDEAVLAPKDVGFVIGHGNGAVHSDRAEAKAYCDFLGERAKIAPTMSPKAVLGDLCEAGGVIGTLLALESFGRGEVPPTMNFSQGDENSSRLALSSGAQAIKSRRGVVTARNFLGLCAALVISAA